MPLSYRGPRKLPSEAWETTTPPFGGWRCFTAGAVPGSRPGLLLDLDLRRGEDLLLAVLLDSTGHLGLLGFRADGLVVGLARLLVEVVNDILIAVLHLQHSHALRLELQVALGAGEGAFVGLLLRLLFLGRRGQRQGEHQRQAQ